MLWYFLLAPPQSRKWGSGEYFLPIWHLQRTTWRAWSLPLEFAGTHRAGVCSPSKRSVAEKRLGWRKSRGVLSWEWLAICWGRECTSISSRCGHHAEAAADWSLYPKWPPRCNDPKDESTRCELSAEELMLPNCGAGEDSWESLGLGGDPTSPSYRKSTLNIHWNINWCWS